MLSYTLSKDGPFQILQITDLHLTHDWHYDVRTLAMVKDLTEFAKPDLIVITGDVFTDGDRFTPDVMEYACRAFDELGVPWAFVMGNHEGDYRYGQGAREKKGEYIRAHGKNALFDPGPDDIFGVGNYTVGITDKAGKLLWVLYMIDSNNRAYYTVNGQVKTCEDHIHFDQIEWYRQTSSRIQQTHGKVPAMAFFHIPLPEYTDAWLFEPCLGDRGEHVTAATVNSGFFAAALGQGDIKGMFVGHDHTNSFAANVFGITLHCCRCTSYEPKIGDTPRGGRVITLMPDGTFESYTVLHVREDLQKEGEPKAYRQQETVSAPYYDRFHFYLPEKK